MSDSIRIEPVSAAGGAVVHGVDLAAVDDAALAVIRKAWIEHLVLFFRGQDFTPEAHRSFARRFGPLEIHPHAAPIDPAFPEVCLLHSERGGRADIWHTDVTYTDSPPIAAIVRYVSGPAVGGDTLFANMYLALEKLSVPMREFLEGLSALHASTIDAGLCHEHPVIRVHPETDRRSLFVNRLFTRSLCQLNPGESGALLAYLYDWCERPEFSVRWSWRPGDVAMWDNRCTQHYAINDYDSERVLHRCIVLGDPPDGPAPRWEVPEPPSSESSSSRAAARVDKAPRV